VEIVTTPSRRLGRATWLSVSIDVTARRAGERALVLSEEQLRAKTEEFKKRISVGNFFSSAILIVAAYSFFARLAIDYVKSLRTTTFVTSALLAVSAVIVVFMMRAAPYSWTDYGFTLKNWRSALADTLLKTLIFIVILTALKWTLTVSGLVPAPVFVFPFFQRYSFLFALGIALTYSVFCILQEVILRSALQHSLMHFLTGRFAKTRIIATTTLIAAATHLQMKSLVFPLLIIIPNIFWCLLYDKHRSLLCVSVSHILIGVWALFVLGSPWQVTDKRLAHQETGPHEQKICLRES
jgi:hypothetical protein